MDNKTSDLDLFSSFLFEAPDDPPDIAEEPVDDTGPPDMPEETTDPPDMPDVEEDPPPPTDTGDADLNDNFDDGSTDDGDGNDNKDSNGSEKEPKELDEKISAIMNAELYPQFLTMLNAINSQISLIKNNNDTLYLLAPDSLVGTLASLKRLDENVRIYLNNIFNRENYSKNLLFFNMCKNLLKVLSNNFGQKVRKGAKSVE